MLAGLSHSVHGVAIHHIDRLKLGQGIVVNALYKTVEDLACCVLRLAILLFYVFLEMEAHTSLSVRDGTYQADSRASLLR